MKTTIINTETVSGLLSTLQMFAKYFASSSTTPTLQILLAENIQIDQELLLWLQHLEVLIPLIKKQWVSVELQHAIIIEIIPLTAYLEHRGYGSTAIYYHEQAEQLCETYWQE